MSGGARIQTGPQWTDDVWCHGIVSRLRVCGCFQGLLRHRHPATDTRAPIGRNDMSAYVVGEASVRDLEFRDRYAPQVGPILQEFGGEVVSFGPWQISLGEPAFNNP